MEIIQHYIGVALFESLLKIWLGVFIYWIIVKKNWLKAMFWWCVCFAVIELIGYLYPYYISWLDWFFEFALLRIFFPLPVHLILAILIVKYRFSGFIIGVVVHTAYDSALTLWYWIIGIAISFVSLLITLHTIYLIYGNIDDETFPREGFDEIQKKVRLDY